MAGPASDYHRGEMNVSEQQVTYQRVMGMTKWGSLYIAASLLFFTLWFCTATGFPGSAITAIVVLVLGTLLLREKKAPAH